MMFLYVISNMLAVLLTLAVSCTLLVSAGRASVDHGSAVPFISGCPNITTFQPADEFDREPAKCFCDADPELSGRMVLSCLWGANLTVIQDLLVKAENAHVPVGHFVVSAGGFTDSVPPRFFSGLNAKSIVIEQCYSDLYLNDTAFVGKPQETVESLTISKCRPANETFFPAISKLGQLTSLVLSRDEILELPPQAFSGLPLIKSLDLSGNFMNVIRPGAFDGLSSLEQLNLGSGNDLNETDLQNILTLTGLRTLDLSKNRFQRLSKGLFAPLKQLQLLDLRLNVLKNVTTAMFSGLDALKTLDLRVNRIDSISTNAFKGLKNLDSLLLAGNYIANISRKTFTGIARLRNLDLSYNEIDTLQANTFAGLKNLESLVLTGNANLKTIYPGALSSLAKLVSLDLSETGLEALDQNAFSGLPDIQNINLAGTQLYKLDNKDLFAPAHNLSILLLNRTRLQSMAEGLFDSIQGTLRHLDISGNPWVCDKKLKWLVTWLKQAPATVLYNSTNTVCRTPEKLFNRTLISLSPDEMTDDLEITTQLPTSTTLSVKTTIRSNRTTTTFLPPDPFKKTTAKTILPQIGTNHTTTVATTTINFQNVTLPQVVKQTGAVDAPSASTNTTGIIVGVVVAVLVLLLVITVIILKRRRRAEHKSEATGTTGVSSNDQSTKSALSSDLTSMENGLRKQKANQELPPNGQTYV